MSDPDAVEHDRAGAGEPLAEAVPVVRQLDPGPVGLDQHGPGDAVVERDRDREVVGVEAAGGVVATAADQVLVIADAVGRGLGGRARASALVLRGPAEQQPVRGQRQHPR
jgi:hypothetical protein